MNRRKFLKYLTAGAASTFMPLGLLSEEARTTGLLTKTIPASGEKIPVIGMGTWITFNVGNAPPLIQQRTRILREFFKHGGGMIDSSPMYGSAEQVVGQCLDTLGYPEGLFSATKIWTSNTGEGREQFRHSQRLWGLDTLDLEQVHNLVNWRDHLKTLRTLKESGKIRYLGITTSHGRRHRELAQIMRTEPIDFVQLTYNAQNDDADNELLPLARDKGIAVIANRPYGGGHLIDFVQKHPFPGWASDYGISSWPDFLLKWIVSHPAVTCAIPATSQVQHMRENMNAGRGRLLSPKERQRMQTYISGL